MAKASLLERLWRLRELEEEQSRVELQSRILRRNHAAEALESAREMALARRSGFAAQIGHPDTVARSAAILDWEQAQRRQTELRRPLEEAQKELDQQREEFLLRRTGRLQVETLASAEREEVRQAVGRRAQQMLDDWYGRRRPAIRDGQEKIASSTPGKSPCITPGRLP